MYYFSNRDFFICKKKKQLYLFNSIFTNNRKTNGKIVIIDGGTQDDAEQLEKYIIDNGGEVYAWFITHPHIDHAGAFEIL